MLHIKKNAYSEKTSIHKKSCVRLCVQISYKISIYLNIKQYIVTTSRRGSKNDDYNKIIFNFL